MSWKVTSWSPAVCLLCVCAREKSLDPGNSQAGCVPEEDNGAHPILRASLALSCYFTAFQDLSNNFSNSLGCSPPPSPISVPASHPVYPGRCSLAAEAVRAFVEGKTTAAHEACAALLTLGAAIGSAGGFTAPAIAGVSPQRFINWELSSKVPLMMRS